jgi:hypothetical protein
MAGRKKNSKSRRSRRGRNSYQTMVSTRQPIAKSALIKHRYASYCTINPGAGVTASHVLSANGMFDPDITSSGHQPLGFDNFSLFYDHYMVLGAKVTVTAVNVSTTVPILFGVTLRDSATVTSSSIDYIKEQGSTGWQYCGNINNSRPPKQVKGFSAKKFFTKGDLRDCAELKGSTGGQPAEQAFFHIWTGAANHSSDPATVTFNFIIEYMALWTEPKPLAQS